ncbi:MAG: hypothetical protein SVN78_01815 [Deferribacterota bacterium]|nr:hypothetical protein [Deferribacterota bacterium]
MREEYLEIKKELTLLKDEHEYLNSDEKEKLRELEAKEKELKNKLDKKDLEIVDQAFANWLKRYLELTTKIKIKPGEDCN